MLLFGDTLGSLHGVQNEWVMGFHSQSAPGDGTPISSPGHAKCPLGNLGLPSSHPFLFMNSDGLQSICQLDFIILYMKIFLSINTFQKRKNRMIHLQRIFHDSQHRATSIWKRVKLQEKWNVLALKEVSLTQAPERTESSQGWASYRKSSCKVYLPWISWDWRPWALCRKQWMSITSLCGELSLFTLSPILGSGASVERPALSSLNLRSTLQETVVYGYGMRLGGSQCHSIFGLFYFELNVHHR